MKDIEEIQNRIRHRKKEKLLSDKLFSNVYNTMIKFMVVMVVGLLAVSYSKTGFDYTVYDSVFDNTNLVAVKSWVNNIYPVFNEEITVSSNVTYQSLGNDRYTNYTNDVICLDSGRVIYQGEDNMGSYITVLLENNVQITYSGLESVYVSLYSNVDKGLLLGMYNESIIMTFEYLGEYMSYESYQRME